MSLRAAFLTVLVLFFLGAGLLYLRLLTRRVALDVPTYREEVARTRLTEAALQSQADTTGVMTLYFPSHDRGQLVAEERSVPWARTETDRIRQVLLALVEGSHEGRSRGLPAGTTIRGVFQTADGTTVLDLGGDPSTEFGPGISSESLAVYSVVNSLSANIPSVRRVVFLLHGQPVETLGGHVDLSQSFVPDPNRVAMAP
jgi:spore germination protein GerM